LYRLEIYQPINLIKKIPFTSVVSYSRCKKVIYYVSFSSNRRSIELLHCNSVILVGYTMSVSIYNRRSDIHIRSVA